MFVDGDKVTGGKIEWGGSCCRAYRACAGTQGPGPPGVGWPRVFGFGKRQAQWLASL